jgi:predicted dienelactone hydrolase
MLRLMLLVGFSSAVLAAYTGESYSVGVGFQRLEIPGLDGPPMEIGVWYPTRNATTSVAIGLFEQPVAINGVIEGRLLPLIVVSHGSGGSMASHYDTALELARQGFVVVAPTHPGDNTRDQSAAGNRRDLLSRPRHIHAVIDYMLTEWSGRAHLDGNRIGLLGVSLGGFTGLVLAGGSPDLAQLRRHCQRTTDRPECQFVLAHRGDQLDSVTPPTDAWTNDRRIGALVLAAPAIGFLFEDSGLRRVRIPVQLWRAGDDRESPNSTSSDVIERLLPRPPDVHTADGAGHFIFLPPCSPSLASVAASICEDPPGVDRAAFHARWNDSLGRFFTRALPGRSSPG